jgi:8-oxo-dGTP diphosphatase
MQPKLFVATKALVSYKGKILVVRESAKYKDSAHLGGFDVIGGRLEAGEHVEESLLREVKEETGLAITIGKPFFVNESWPVVREEQWQIIRIFYACETNTDQVILGGDHDELLWIDPKEYKEHGLIDNLYPAFEAYLAL